MRCIAIFMLAISLASITAAQEQANANGGSAAAPGVNDGVKGSFERLGSYDLIGITVYDSPELTRNVRVDPEGDIRLPMVKQHIRAAGLTPEELERSISGILVDEKIMVSPIVTVTVAEYHSRPITIVGAVRSPATIQATGSVTLLDAISRAGGVTESAGSEILVTHAQSTVAGASVESTDRIPLNSLINVADPTANLKLEGGEIIRVPEAGRVFVAGNVKRPGAFTLTNESNTTVLKALSLSGGLDSFSSGTAYIYRADKSSGRTDEIPIEIKKIVSRKSPDVALYGNDMLYVPNASGQRMSAKALQYTVGAGLGLAALLVYITR
jgi:polysaccharide biosynthesis/export protein